VANALPIGSIAPQLAKILFLGTAFALLKRTHYQLHSTDTKPGVAVSGLGCLGPQSRLCLRHSVSGRGKSHPAAPRVIAIAVGMQRADPAALQRRAHSGGRHTRSCTIYTRFNVPHRFIVPRPPEPEHVTPTFVPPTLPNVYIY
jgi:hypothetical protein